MNSTMHKQRQTQRQTQSWLRRVLHAAAAGILLSLAAAASAQPVPATSSGATAKAVFAGGCFWCVESDFDKVPGVISTTSGYTGGKTVNPTYEQVSAHTTGHAEAVQIVYDPAKVSYAKLVDYFWRSIDPTVKDQQFCDHGSPYRSAIFAQNEEQLKIATASRAALEKTKPFKEAVVTEIVMAGTFYPAEEYHQDYYKKNPIRYQYYRSSCGRDARVKQLWGSAPGH
ncbi:MAG: peptide-methionine (S)-S-oxide reductase MsrA [Undibacterium sp.]|nr:peptide-methionine (S)-S-oxide reductase MsrA [Undibacterium sp.]